MLFLLSFNMMLGVSDSLCFFAWVRGEEKNIASVLDLCFGDPTYLKSEMVKVVVDKLGCLFCFMLGS